jgi:hypothetical protein
MGGAKSSSKTFRLLSFTLILPTTGDRTCGGRAAPACGVCVGDCHNFWKKAGRATIGAGPRSMEAPQYKLRVASLHCSEPGIKRRSPPWEPGIDCQRRSAARLGGVFVTAPACWVGLSFGTTAALKGTLFTRIREALKRFFVYNSVGAQQLGNPVSKAALWKLSMY